MPSVSVIEGKCVSSSLLLSAGSPLNIITKIEVYKEMLTYVFNNLTSITHDFTQAWHISQIVLLAG